LKITFKWIENKNDYSIFVGDILFGHIRMIDKNQYLCSFYYTFLKSIIHKTHETGKKYMETEIKNYVNNLLKGIEYGT
jgi:hypothetical protein